MLLILQLLGTSFRFFPPHVPWYSLVWFKVSLPRHGFICWLAFLNILATRDRLLSWLRKVSPDCLSCGRVESKDYLFFAFPFSSQVWTLITAIGKSSGPSYDWSSIVHWILVAQKRQTSINLIMKLALQATIYHL